MRIAAAFARSVRSTLTAAASASLAAVAFAAPAFADAAPGQPAPSFTATGISGETIAVPDPDGRRMVLEWTNHGCPFVKKHYNSGNMQATQAHAAEQGVVWVSVISSAPGKQGHVDAEEARELTTSRDAHPADIVLDPSGEIGRLYGAKATPHMFVIDHDGTVAYAGAIDSIPSGAPEDIETAENYVLSALDALEAGEPVKTAATQAYGCDVKYDN